MRQARMAHLVAMLAYGITDPSSNHNKGDNLISLKIILFAGQISMNKLSEQTGLAYSKTLKVKV